MIERIPIPKTAQSTRVRGGKVFAGKRGSVNFLDQIWNVHLEAKCQDLG